MDPLNAVIAALDELEPTTIVWPRGLMHPGGPHRRLKGMFSPISIGEDECRAFGRLIAARRPAEAFVIGNAFGLSSAYIALAMQQHGGRRIVTLDSQAEGDGARCAGIAAALADKLDLGLLTQKKGRSPEDVPGAVEAERHELLFIDGLHAHPQVTHDLDAVLPYAAEDGVIVWHDYWIPGVPEAVMAARERGWSVWWIPTSCEMVLGTRDPEVFRALRETFPEGTEALPTISRIRPLGVIGGLLWGYWRERLTG